ncbi:enoyl-CoA hydratase/isomerase family protein [Salsipaludibacter albus]|uniref:enoyl-CoA hydratase/isomerase family protein n=1 Tax=Salsipaludibacter albus TaxID=2849650 RepID=UPI001EE43C5D|nr:enoyl-CoA hydratase/isomerase family protein [Salsipaludibacter albus]MBY5163054.1 enoyl-CoA hydratase/isomerase family protein [Salsipaludibacter albus]
MAELVSLDVDTDTGVGVVELQRPPMNPISLQLARELTEHVRVAVDDPDCRALVVWGGPKVFAAGADVKEFPDWGPDEGREAAVVLHRAMDSIAEAPLVSIAAIAGYALGGGFELALACDFRVAAEDAKVGFPEVQLGLLPGAGGTQRIARLVGPNRAKDLVFSGRMVDMEEAAGLGIVNRVVAGDDLFTTATSMAATFAAGPASIALAKRAIDEGVGLGQAEAMALEQELFATAFGTEDKDIGVRSFLDSGPGRAEFVGR